MQAKKGSEYDVGDFRKLPCKYAVEGKRHIGARQIFPIPVHDAFRTPICIHGCCRTKTAAAQRACSNKVTADPEVFKLYAQWFRDTIIKEWMQWLDETTMIVDVKEWLRKYSKEYGRNLLQSHHPDNRTYEEDEKHMWYGAFSKSELQVTMVLHWLKDTILEDSKERQICVPEDEKKLIANAFVNKLEEIASERDKYYCGRSNWEDICHSIDEWKHEHPNMKWCAADGSGFDMTQLVEHNELFNELIDAILDHPNCVLDEMLSVEEIRWAFRESLVLRVGVDNGKLKYEAQGRASGDGWTTFANTTLMASYWRFTHHLAGIEEFFLKAKGDDTITSNAWIGHEKFQNAVDRVFTRGKHQHQHGLAQICKMLNIGDISDLDFLSNDFFYNAEGNIRMTRKPHRVFQTNSWTTKIPEGMSAKKMEELRLSLCYSKGKCLEAWGRDLPIFGVLAKKMIELGRPGKATEYNQHVDAGRRWEKTKPNDYEAYLLYLENRFGVTTCEVKEIEQRINALTSLTGILDLPWIDKFYPE